MGGCRGPRRIGCRRDMNMSGGGGGVGGPEG